MYLLLPVLVLFLSSCSSTYYSMKSTEEPTYWNQGTGYNSRTYKGVTYLVGPANDIDDGQQFAVQIENKSTQPITVNSQYFTLISGDTVLNAEDPEALIEKFNKDIAYERSTYDPLAGNLIGTIMDIGNRSEEAKARQKQRDKEAADNEAKIKELTDQRDRVATKYLRKTTLKPGETINGLILFKTYSNWKIPNKNFLIRIANIKEASNTIPFIVVEN